MGTQLANRTWSEVELDGWVLLHSDAWHPGTREDCSHCQEMIGLYGDMPPAQLIESHFASKRKVTRRTKHTIPPATRWQVWERDNFTCRHCGSRRDLSVDHIVAESKGGANDIGNYQTLCRRCNGAKAAK